MAPAVLAARTLLFLASVGVAAIAGYKAHEVEVEDGNAKRKKQTMTPDQALQRELIDVGTKRLTSRTQPTSKAEMSQYVSNTYSGLYCLGRAGATLKGAMIEPYTRDLARMHHLLRPKADAKLVEWYQLGGAGQSASLVELLAKCPEVKRLGVDPRYIAHALGEPVEGLTFAGLSKEMAKRFAA